MYGPSLSMIVHRLPFNLYLRNGTGHLASKDAAEARTLQLLEEYCPSIPAPRLIDVVDTGSEGQSYLLMTRVPGVPFGVALSTMTDEQVRQAVQDLKGYIKELRGIPKSTIPAANSTF